MWNVQRSIGFWKRDWNKSDADVFTFGDKGDVFTFTGAGGSTISFACDGKDHPYARVLYSCSFPDERTYELAFKENGKVYMTRTSKISEDGKKMVRIAKNGEGKALSELSFEKIE